MFKLLSFCSELDLRANYKPR